VLVFFPSTVYKISLANLMTPYFGAHILGAYPKHLIFKKIIIVSFGHHKSSFSLLCMVCLVKLFFGSIEIATFWAHVFESFQLFDFA
jgi:hypothetical protein